MSLYAKAIAAFFTGLSTWGFTALVDDAISTAELFGLFGVIGSAFAVYAIPNIPPRDPLTDQVPPV